MASRIINYSVRSFPCISEGMDPWSHELAVLTQDGHSKKAVYIAGISQADMEELIKNEDSAAASRILDKAAANGTKQTYQQAVHSFPTLDRNEYRR